MGSIRYFAYGSNMLVERLRRRCASARVRETACVEGLALAFMKRSRDGSGKAMLAASELPGACAHGVIFEIDVAELGALDRSEGRGNGYHREDAFEVKGATAGAVLLTTYIADPGAVDASLKPYDWYLDLVVAGAREHRLPPAYIEGLAATLAIGDPDVDRVSRQEALTLLCRTKPR